MCAFNPREQERLAHQRFNATDILAGSLNRAAPWDSITDFVTHRSYCGFPIFPKQSTLLKLIFLETEQMTQYDIDTIEDWRSGFMRVREVYGVQPDIWQRIDYLKARGYRRFPWIQMVLGRRGSKGTIGGAIGAEQIAYLHSLDNPQAVFSIAADKDIYFNVGATNQTTAKRQLFRDIADMVERCKYFSPPGQPSWIAESKPDVLRVRTPADLRKIAAMKAAKIPIDHVIASLVGVALGASSVSGRGATSCANYYDEFAFHVQTGSVKSDDEIYKAWQPSLGQFDKEALTYIPSSPWCLEPGTRVLTEDLRWVPVESLQVGDRLVGFDEQTPKRGKGRTWQPATVTETSILQAPRLELRTESGKAIKCTGEHMWLTKRVAGMGRGKGRGDRSQSYPQDWCWIKTSDLRPGDQIKSLGVQPWETDESRDGGYLEGFYDGEGHITGQLGNILIGGTQKNGVVLDRVLKLLADRGYQVRIDETPDNGNHYSTDRKDVVRFRFMGGLPETMRFLGTIRPQRLLDKFADKFWGSRIYGHTSGTSFDRVVSVEEADPGPVVALGTSTSTLVAEGLLSHNTKAGAFYVLYQQARVLMDAYNDAAGVGDDARQNLINVGQHVELNADPTRLIFQGPSWGLYENWQDVRKILSVGYSFDKAPEPDLTSEKQQRERNLDPDSFLVEKMGQFREVLDAYLDPDDVDAMFLPPGWRDPLVMQERGVFSRVYRIHCDPGRSGANFALAIGHTEEAPPDKDGLVWPHVIFDVLKVWRPIDYPMDEETKKRKVDYVGVHQDLEHYLDNFASTRKISFDQWNSAYFLDALKEKYGMSKGIQVSQVDFTEKENQARFEAFKTMLGLGWVHAPIENFYTDNLSCLLELELKFLSTKPNGKVDRQETGPVTTKDLADAVMVVTVDLLKDALNRFRSGNHARGAYGSTYGPGLRTGEEQERVAAAASLAGLGINNSIRENGMRARDTLASSREVKERLRQQGRSGSRRPYGQDRLRSIHSREPRMPR